MQPHEGYHGPWSRKRFDVVPFRERRDRTIDVRRQSLGRHLPCSYNDRVVAQLNRMEHANEFGRRRSEIVRYLGALN